MEKFKRRVSEVELGKWSTACYFGVVCKSQKVKVSGTNGVDSVADWLQSSTSYLFILPQVVGMFFCLKIYLTCLSCLCIRWHILFHARYGKKMFEKKINI
jgi:hypothetical protein